MICLSAVINHLIGSSSIVLLLNCNRRLHKINLESRDSQEKLSVERKINQLHATSINICFENFEAELLLFILTNLKGLKSQIV